RLLVEKTLYDDVVAQVTELAQKVKVGDPLDAETQMGSLISTSHRERVHGFVDGARAAGAEITTGGAIGEGAGAFYPPTVMPYTAFPGIPFGGYKQSGFGRELALETLDLYLETKSVVTYTGSRPTNPFGL